MAWNSQDVGGEEASYCVAGIYSVRKGPWRGIKKCSMNSRKFSFIWFVMIWILLIKQVNFNDQLSWLYVALRIERHSLLVYFVTNILKVVSTSFLTPAYSWRAAICSVYFKPDDIVTCGGKFRLRRGAMPALYLPKKPRIQAERKLPAVREIPLPKLVHRSNHDVKKSFDKLPESVRG